MSRGVHVNLDTVARYCAKAGLGSVAHCRDWLEREFKAKRRVVINGRSLAGYRDVKGKWWCLTSRMVKVFGLTLSQANALRGIAESRRAPTFPPTTKRLKRGDCVACVGTCRQRVLIEMDADLSWDGRPSASLVAELTYHRTVPRAMTVRISPR
ncbi:hypothetical protein [Streptomyces olivochromogenes]|uniref:Uncharacterized protein n=1 Tax=Streptomyces olivochromogenes TaxID=1963 RepID=A0A250VF58_STROL|nr:hypothetical protein [Streptomyces olivochromogenes]KUN47422.1 hypothetical protein AQJ27_10830 [Streptomyces olivochromogenes]GAX52838.1 hypothetical protein SO3561_04357 [Streptomyces olivochromogenes]